MARSKHSAALFEVIHSAKRPGLLRTPKWWFKGNGGDAAQPEPAPEPIAAAAPVEEPAVAAPVIPTSMYGSRPTTRMRLDRDRNEVTMRMRLGTVVVGGFALLVALGLAYVVGQHVSNGPKSADASDLTTTDVIRQKPPIPDSLEVPKRTAKPASGNKVKVSSAVGHPTDGASTARPKPLSATSGGDSTPAEARPAVSGPRDPGKNYFLVGTYEPRNRKTADKICEVLNAGGVPVSIEKVPTGYGNNPEDQYVAIITQQGFTGNSDPQRKICEDRIIEVARKANLKISDMALVKGTKLR